VRTRTVLRMSLLVGGAVALVSAGSPAHASPPHPMAVLEPHVTIVNQVSDQASVGAPVTDPDLVNPWGLALSPTSPLWVANNGTNTATIYSGGINGAPVTKAGLTVRIPNGAPTGEVFNDTDRFLVTGPGGSGPARFIFASEGGDITAWNPTAAPTDAIVMAHVGKSSYKGLTLLHTRSGPFLLAANFAQARVDVFDSHFHRVRLPWFFFRDRRIPTGYAPFNVFAVGSRVYVSYAQVGPTGDEIDGPGLGFVDVYTNFGLTVHRVATRGALNAPWGMAIAPSTFGSFAGALLVGNFGDGHVSAYRGGMFLGQLRDAGNVPIAIDGLWDLLPGTATTGGVGTLWFSSGPGGEAHGLVGQLIPTP
jgi:uncharacterized protein (TIGR03118 family)